MVTTVVVTECVCVKLGNEKMKEATATGTATEKAAATATAMDYAANNTTDKVTVERGRGTQERKVMRRGRVQRVVCPGMHKEDSVVQGPRWQRSGLGGLGQYILACLKPVCTKDAA